MTFQLKSMVSSPLSKVLVKIFAKGFYKVHAGLLLFLFVTIILYCFYIEVLNQTHLSPDEIILFNLSFVLSLISSPVLGVFVAIVWLGFTVKSWNYISTQILIPENQFLFYSSNAIKKSEQFRSWLLVQLIISLPIIIYGLFALVVGIVFDYYLIPIIILTYAFLLACISALVYMKTTNSLLNAYQKAFYLKFTTNWRKPFFSLFIYHSLNNLQVTLAITKLLSFVMIIGGTFFLADVQNDLRVTGLITLEIVLSNCMLLYQSYHFETTQLIFSRNFPYSRGKIFLNQILNYLLITFPENIWLIVNFHPFESSALILFNLGTGMFFRSMLYLIKPDIKKYIYRVFYLFLLFFLLIMFNLIWILIPVNLLLSFFIFYKQYHRIADL